MIEKGETDSWLPLIGSASLWLPAMLAASYSWSHGEYYDYGWFIPPAALILVVRRWKDDPSAIALPARVWVMASVAFLVPWFLVLRVLGYVDPGWRMPTGLLALTAATFSHLLIGVSRGWKSSLGYAWITLLLMSAVPWPSSVEQGIIRQLTDSVIATVAEIFHNLGKPVEILGDRLRLYETTVEVTDGCSGVRSFQSFVMATWFFAELQRLNLFQAFILILLACGIAFVVNTARTFALATIRFQDGQAAFDRAHDPAGLLAFLVSAVLFYFLSGYLSSQDKRRLVRTIQNRES